MPEFREFLVEFLLFAAKVLRDFHADVHVEASTVAALVQRVQALFAQAQNAPGLGAGRNLDLHFATVQRRDSLRTAKHQLVDRHLGILMEISSVSCTRPSPRQWLHGFAMTSPMPLQVGQALSETIWKKPPDTRRTRPDSVQVGSHSHI